ncbi:diguanylate cyclase [Agarivorans aestuarii]|uniref:Diguanylate cyclase n=1 Tax=Agarivorans aestuarii TaxID=1563703 RepID=A0ABU7G5S2_9ALTE|nr:diguanylate cyclase [Agarivorans aestuarii]MEE1674752.1 diguanylate cyclase [Agarivorans aestuarii]
MKILLLGEQPLGFSSQDCHQHSDIESLLDELQINHCIVVNLAEPQQSVVLKQLRAHELAYLVPIFYAVEANAESQVLADGNFDEQAQLSCSTYLERLARLHPTLQSQTNRLISFLWLLPQRRISPFYDATKWYYRYPLLECWQEQSHSAWLNSLEKEAVLSKAELIDRVRQCKSCKSSTLNYVETCPSCNSIDVSLYSALHCFTCGHVASQAEFQQNSALVCPNCQTQLRHIGVDYDRPIENHRCNSCSQLFIDGEVRANCHSCGTSNRLEELSEELWHAYRLAERGELWAQSGKQTSLMPEGLGEPVSSEHFRWLLGWQNQLAQRHQQEHLLLALHFSNLQQLYSELPSSTVFAQLDEFFERFQNLIRQTDIVCRWNQDLLMFLLPNFAPEHSKVLEAKLLSLAEEQTDNPLELSVRFRQIPNSELAEQAEQWLLNLVAELRQ